MVGKQPPTTKARSARSLKLLLLALRLLGNNPLSPHAAEQVFPPIRREINSYLTPCRTSHKCAQKRNPRSCLLRPLLLWGCKIPLPTSRPMRNQPEQALLEDEDRRQDALPPPPIPLRHSDPGVRSLVPSPGDQWTINGLPLQNSLSSIVSPQKAESRLATSSHSSPHACEEWNPLTSP